MRGIRKSIRKRIRWIAVLTVFQLFLLCMCQVVIKKVVVSRYEKTLQEKEEILEAAGRIAYITKAGVRAGEEFTEENVELRYVLSEQDAGTLEKNAIGTVACVDLPAGVILNTSVCRRTEYGLSERYCTFRGIRFSECFELYDSVDVRIRYGNGENYCVLREKCLLPTTGKGDCCFLLNETEQLMMSAAGFDAERYDGAELYLVGVPSGTEEEERLSVFIPAIPVLLQLRELDEKNATFSEAGCELRTELEMRLQEHEK